MSFERGKNVAKAGWLTLPLVQIGAPNLEKLQLGQARSIGSLKPLLLQENDSTEQITSSNVFVAFELWTHYIHGETKFWRGKVSRLLQDKRRLMEHLEKEAEAELLRC